MTEHLDVPATGPAPVARSSVHRRNGARRRVTAWREQHAHSFLSSRTRIGALPWATALTVLVMAVALALPLLLHVLINGGYHAFADAELEQREAAGFPPFAHLALLRAEAKHADPPVRFLQLAKDLLGDAGIERSGPLPAPMPRRAGYQRAQLLLSSPQRRQLHAALDALMPPLYAAPEARKVRWSLDVDPAELY